jgi:myo-inositol 2-dehydrogenase / D-chiro-inositol 1-dehydrogenase
MLPPNTPGQDALLEDPEVDVVAICSPDRFHAGQVAAVAAAGKRAIL